MILARREREAKMKPKVLSRKRQGKSSWTEEDPRLTEYRDLLVRAGQKAQDDYDRNVIALSGGAIGVSFVFLRDVIKQSAKASQPLMLGAWIAWGLSIATVVASYFFSKKALDTAIDQVDAGEIRRQKAGKTFSTVVSVLNPISGGLFFVGVVLLAVFVYNNL
jgi:hypothetical protein